MTQETLRDFSTRWLPAIESEMRAMLSSDEPALAAYYGMMQYHMGWLNQAFQADHAAAGKRLRPLLCLLACAEVGGDPAQALPAAAAIEILHNFSLVHDDIEDGDETRRHRATVWVLWGEPQAINVGDGMFALAFASLQRMTGHHVADAIVLRALQIFTETCVALTEGQYLDMSFEQRVDVTVPEYLRMIQGKTAALVGASVAIGALVGGATPAQDASLQRFGQAIGLAFQIQDDILGIWGDPAVTGKAAGNDLLRKKKSLPLLHALNDARVGAQFGALMAGDIGPDQVTQAFKLLDEAGSRAYAEAEARTWHDHALAALRAAMGERMDNSALLTLTEGLLGRAK